MSGTSIGELFVDLGIKGQQKTIGALTDVKTGLGEAKSMALETKAGILAIVYGLEQMMSASMQAGTSLSNFNTLTGISIDKLQEYQYVTRLVGGSNEEMAQTFKNVSDKMAAYGRGEGDPRALRYMQSQLKEEFDPNRYRDAEYMIQQFQKFAQLKDVGEDMKRWALGAMGLGEHVQVGLMRGMYNDKNFAQAPKYSKAEAAELDRMRAEWSKLATEIEMAFGHFNAKHGGEIIKFFKRMTKESEHFAESLLKISERLGAFEKIGNIFEGITNTLKLGNEIMDRLDGKKSKPGDLLYTPPGKEALPGWKGSPLERLFHGHLPSRETEGFQSDTLDALKDFFRQFQIPKDKMEPKQVGGPHSSIEFNQTLEFNHEGKDAMQTADSTKRAVQLAFRALSSQGQVT